MKLQPHNLMQDLHTGIGWSARAHVGSIELVTAYPCNKSLFTRTNHKRRGRS